MFSDTPDILPFTSPFRIEPLTPAELIRLQAGTLHLLEHVGVHFPSGRALEILAEHGANVDFDHEIVRIPPDIVRSALANAPRAFVLGGREERFDLFLDGTRSYLATDGTGVHWVDPETGQRRASRREDVALMARVCDALPVVSFYWPPVSAQDFGITAPLHQCYAGLTNTLKHVRGGMTVPPPLASYAVEMATVVAGSQEARRSRPPICANICTIAPLAQDTDGIETALIYAEAGIPVSFMAMTTMGSTAPATALGALVVGDAEVISAMVLIQLAFPGAPVFHSIIASLMDPRTGGYISYLPTPIATIATQLAHAWGVPSLGGGSVSSDASSIGWQMGMEAGLGASLIPLSGAEICGFLGLLDASMVLHPEQILLDQEVCLRAHELYRGFEFDDRDMALDVIANVGPRGHFLKEQHTRHRIRSWRLPELLRQKDSDGRPRDPRQVAKEEFRRISQAHHPAPLPETAAEELERILRAAERHAARITEQGEKR
jgi:trimethylamine--corrinoid protein Co-methyltransferase